ncbi:CLUMA_CG005242, isoform A [Clunio marinus]|uniref:CLUMA_CG005242, isoform A n=1 Tax=Clunio marinus TaxID=568069 RepID=A0A1J1HW52_9DIPT|nr:CLUMA_CG005242, isoform A [Clunio marinus]
MAKVIPKNYGKDILEVVKWQEFIAIYVHSVVLNFFIVCKNTLLSLKTYFDNRFAPTRQHIAHKFPALSIIGKRENKVSKQHQSIACPQQLMDPKLGQHKYIKLKKTKLHYVESGDENDHPILLLHGFPDCFFGWRYQIPVLSQSHRVIALDLKGFNDSDKPVLRHNYRPNVICSEIRDFLDVLNIKAATIIGHDIGGVVGWIFIQKFPEYASKFIAISACHPNFFWHPSKTALTTRSWFTMIQTPLLPENELKKNVRFIEKFYGHLKKESSIMEFENGEKVKGLEQIETYKYIFNSSLDWTGPLNYFRNLMFYRVKSGVNVKCPCILISGNDDPNYKLETIIKSAEFCENSSIRIIEGAGRFPHQSHWNEVNQILVKYLGGTRRRIIQEEVISRGLVGRMINKVYGVSQHYTNLSVNGNIFSGLST